MNDLVTWGENQRWGKAAAKVGVRDGQVILGADDMRACDSIDHFHTLSLPGSANSKDKGFRSGWFSETARNAALRYRPSDLSSSTLVDEERPDEKASLLVGVP